uniref:Uncharacterized protein n=1 Tax=Anguilla anguilla TaxID=7936 RepID=A0A0E9TR78_ANGAN
MLHSCWSSECWVVMAPCDMFTMSKDAIHPCGQVFPEAESDHKSVKRNEFSTASCISITEDHNC